MDTENVHLFFQEKYPHNSPVKRQICGIKGPILRLKINFESYSRIRIEGNFSYPRKPDEYSDYVGSHRT